MPNFSPYSLKPLLSLLLLLATMLLGLDARAGEVCYRGNAASSSKLHYGENSKHNTHELGDCRCNSLIVIEVFLYRVEYSFALAYNTKGEVVNTDHNNNAYDKSQNFDGIGNRTTATDATGVTNYTSNHLNQYTAVGTVTRTHDDDGNTLGGVKTANNTQLNDIKWNGNNRLTKVTTADGKLVFVEYDHMGRRFKKSVVDNGVTKRTAWIYSGYNAIAKYEADSNASLSLKKTFYWGLDSFLSEYDVIGGKNYFSNIDGNQNITEFLDSTGTVAAHFEYDSFGNTLTSSGLLKDQMDYGFSSEINDRDLGLIYFNFRYINTLDGRWIDRDPIGEAGGANAYGYLANDGINLFDMRGLEPNVRYDSLSDAVKAASVTVGKLTSDSVAAGKLEYKNTGLDISKQKGRFFKRGKNYFVSRDPVDKIMGVAVADNSYTYVVYGVEYGTLIFCDGGKYYYVDAIRGKVTTEVTHFANAPLGYTVGSLAINDLVDLSKTAGKERMDIVAMVHSHNVDMTKTHYMPAAQGPTDYFKPKQQGVIYDTSVSKGDGYPLSPADKGMTDHMYMDHGMDVLMASTDGINIDKYRAFNWISPLPMGIGCKCRGRLKGEHDPEAIIGARGIRMKEESRRVDRSVSDRINRVPTPPVRRR